MSTEMEEGIKLWTARRKSALVPIIIQGKTTVAKASGQVKGLAGAKAGHPTSATGTGAAFGSIRPG